MKNIKLWETKLTPVKTLGIDNQDQIIHFHISQHDTWVVTTFARNLNDDLTFIVQPLVRMGGEEGVTGNTAYALTEEELNKVFELKKDNLVYL